MSPRQDMTIEDIRAEIQEYLRRSPYKDKVESISLFGSRIHNTATGDSDIDLLVSFKQRVGYFTLVRLQNDLARSLQQPVDLVTAQALSPHFREEVLKEAVSIYEE